MKPINNNCPCCESKNSHFLYKLKYGDVYQCIVCNTAYTAFEHTEFTGKSNEVFESSEYIKTRLYDQYRLRKVARKRLKLLNRFIDNGSILEFGSCTGEFLYEAAQKGYTVSSVDIHPSILYINKTENLKEVIKSDASVHKDKRTYDAIAAFHLIEHLTNPGEFLSNCYRSLNADGVLFLEMPNFGALSRRIWGRRSGLLYDYHVCHFDRHSLESLLRKHNYHIICTITIDETARYISLLYNPVRNAIWNTIKRLVNIHNNIPVKVNSDNAAQVIDKQYEMEIINSLKAKTYRVESGLLNGLSVIFYPLSLLLNLFGLGSYIQVIARKDSLI